MENKDLNTEKDKAFQEEIDFYRGLSKYRLLSYNVSPDSFNIVAQTLFGYGVKGAQLLYDDFRKIVSGMWDWERAGEKDTINVIVQARKILDEAMSLVPRDRWRTIRSFIGKEQFDDRNRIGVYVSREGGAPQLFDLNITSPENLSLIAKIEQADDAEVVCIVPWVDSIETRYCQNTLKDGQREMRVYDGDVFLVTSELGRSLFERPNENGVYVCQWGAYRRLLYTHGRGYVTRDLDANIASEDDEDSKDVLTYGKDKFSHYLLTLGHTWKRIGNIHVDISFLQEK